MEWEKDKFSLDEGLYDIVNHYHIHQMWILIFWIRTPEIIDLSMPTLNINEIMYDPLPHGEIEPPAPLPAWMFLDDDENLPLLEDEDKLIDEKEENEVQSAVQ